MPRRLPGRDYVLPVARASATAAPTPPRHGSPWPKPITAASHALEPVDRRERLRGVEPRTRPASPARPSGRSAGCASTARRRPAAPSGPRSAARRTPRCGRARGSRAGGRARRGARRRRTSCTSPMRMRLGLPGAGEHADQPPCRGVAQVGEHRAVALAALLRERELLVGRVHVAPARRARCAAAPRSRRGRGARGSARARGCRSQSRPISPRQSPSLS